jgi:hypothetical protein
VTGRQTVNRCERGSGAKVTSTFQPLRRLLPLTLPLALVFLVAECAPGKPIESSIGAPPGDLVAVRLSPDSVSVSLNGATDFSVELEFSDGSIIPGTGVTFEATGGSITSSGHYVAGATGGSYRVIASLEDKADTSIVTIALGARTLTGISIDPASAALIPGGSQQFSATGVMSDGSDSSIAVTWSATGGTVDATGLYVAPSVSGTYQLVAAQQGGTLRDTAQIIVTVPPPSLVAVILTPASVTLLAGRTQQFSAVGQLSDGSSVATAVTWTATGGTVNSTGRYTAGSTAGTFRVIARAANGLADTSSITITTPTITALTVTPATVTLQTGQTRQFAVTATLSNGSTQTNPAVTWTATGGIISTAGLYTAGTTTGTFLAIATAGNGVADTSIVTIVPPATITGIVVSPVSASVAAGQTQQFSVTATLSSGGTQANPSVTWNATGGMISAGGQYTAGTTTGTFRVIAVLQGGTLADTSDVTITPPGTGPYANRPANYGKILTNYGFGDVPPAGAGLAYADGWYVNNYGEMDRVTDANAPVSPSSALQWTYERGGTSGTSVGIVYHQYPANTTEFYVAFSLWHDSNFEWNTISNKLFYIEPGNIILESKTDNDYLTVYIGATGTLYKATNPRTSPLGQWVNIELLVKRGNPGVVKVWMNGTLVMDRTPAVPGPGSYGELKLDSTWGGATSARTRDSFRRVDHSLIATP